MYLVIMSGVYIQAVYGPFSDEGEAHDFARDRAKLEPDDYHFFGVVALTRNGVNYDDVPDQYRGLPPRSAH